MNRRHLLLVTRAEISDGAARTLLEIMLHASSEGQVPSLTEIAQYRGRARSVIQSHISELISCGILLEDKLVPVTEGYGRRLKLSEEGLAKSNGFKSFSEVSTDKFLQVKAGNVRASTQGTSLMPFAAKAENIDSPGRLLKFFQVKHQERYKKPYESKRGDLTFFKNLIKIHGKKRSVRLVEAFFEHHHHFRCPTNPQGLFSIRQSLESKIE